MKNITVTYKKLAKDQIQGLKDQKPQINHVENIISSEAMILLDGQPVAVYKKVDFELLDLLWACQSLNFESTTRTDDLKSKTINFNFSPRNARRENVCRKSKLAYDQPALHQVFTDHGKKVAQMYRKYFKNAFAGQIKHSYVGKRRVHREYLMKGTPFTGGVINKDSNMNYHFDNANTTNGMSCMLILKENVAGGELILPELNIGFECQDNYILLFDGQKYLHGVTDILKMSGGYRYTIVYYNSKGMYLCLPQKEEYEHYQTWLDRPKDYLPNKLE